MKTVVLVEDEFGLADVLVATLSDAGFRVLAAKDGTEGLALMAETVPDFALVDYMMPRLDGPGVVKAMRADARLAGVPVILMSAMPEGVVRKRATEYQAFLRKPFDFESLLRAIKQVSAAGDT